MPTVSELTIEINKLRAQQDALHESQKHASQTLTAFRREEEALVQEYQKRLDEVRKRKQASVDLANSIVAQITGTKHSIDELLALQAKLLEQQKETDFLAQLEKDLEEYLEKIAAWKLAADFQKAGVLEMFKAYRSGMTGFLNADDMGLGKTLQAILGIALLQQEFMKEFNRKPRILWLTKKSLITSTCKEFLKWNPDTLIVPVNGGAAVKERESMFRLAMQAHAVVVANYEVVNTMTLVKATDWDFVFVDECHRLKGGANVGKPSQIWKNTKDICRKARFVVMLSGTPMVNHPREMWAYLHVFDPERFDSLRRFEQIFSVYDHIKGDYVLSADKLLQGALKGQCVRRRKNEVGLQLPELLPVVRELEMPEGQRAVYDQMRNNFFVWLDGQDQSKPLTAAAIIAQLTRLRQISVYPAGIEKDLFDEDLGAFVHQALECKESGKIDEAMDIISELNDDDEQVVLFCTFNAPLFEIKRRCNEQGITCEVIYGGHDSTGLDEEFQQGRVKVLCINMAMSEGLNLQKSKDWPGGASNAIFLDLWWTPARNEQAMARIHRIGAVVESCTIHILHNVDSVDAFIAGKVEEKAAQFANILERKELRPASEWKNLLKDVI
jgi:SNF2 family DNA or RNA helicase